jgi:hypothetical protein
VNLAFRLKLWFTWVTSSPWPRGWICCPGVIALREAELSAAMQWERLNTALAFAEKTCNGDLINRVLEVQKGGECLLHAIPAEHVN